MNKTTFVFLVVFFFLLFSGALILIKGSLISSKPHAQATPTPLTEIKENGQEEGDTYEPAGGDWTTYKDPLNYLSIDFPSNWKTNWQSAQGVRLTGLLAESSDFKITMDNSAEGPFTPISYESGAMVQISVEQGMLDPNRKPAGAISVTKQIVVAGQKATYYEFKEPSTAKGQLLEAQFSYNGNSYFIRLGFSPTNFSHGVDFFEAVLASVRLLK